jgi:hypothetical protein
MSFSGSERPPRRWYHASTTLEDFAVVTFRVGVDQLVRHVPSRFEPRSFTFSDGSIGALVSVVAFVERDFAFRFAPFIRVSGALVDYRAYGSVDGEPGVFVFATSLDHPFVVVPRRLWRMPWSREPVRIDASWGGSGGVRFEVTTDGAGGLTLVLAGRGRPVGALDGFADGDEALAVLTHPMAGWYGDDDDLRRYSVWHDVLVAEEASIESCRIPQFADLGLIDAVDAGPVAHSALLVERATFDVHTPPRRVRRRTVDADRGEPDDVVARGLP